MEPANVNADPICNFYLGSYEGKLYSVDVDLKKKKVVSSYAFKVSENSLKIIVQKDSHVFASGVDEIVHIFDMKKREDKGSVVTYSGSVSNLQIVKNFLFASGDESTISIWRMTDFNLIHNLKGHKSAVNAFVVHKSGKFGISSSRDNTLIVWNLITGIKIIKYNFKNNLMCNKILLIQKETIAVLIFDNEFWLFDLFKNSEDYEEWVLKKVKVTNKISEAFVFKDALYVVHGSGDITVYDNIVESETSKELTLEKPAKTNEEDLDIRVKLLNTSKSKKINLLNVVFTNNQIYLYDLNKMNKLETTPGTKTSVKKYMELNISTADRITCLNTNLV